MHGRAQRQSVLATRKAAPARRLARACERSAGGGSTLPAPRSTPRHRRWAAAARRGSRGRARRSSAGPRGAPAELGAKIGAAREARATERDARATPRLTPGQRVGGGRRGGADCVRAAPAAHSSTRTRRRRRRRALRGAAGPRRRGAGRPGCAGRERRSGGVWLATGDRAACQRACSEPDRGSSVTTGRHEQVGGPGEGHVEQATSLRARERRAFRARSALRSRPSEAHLVAPVASGSGDWQASEQSRRRRRGRRAASRPGALRGVSMPAASTTIGTRGPWPCARS